MSISPKMHIILEADDEITDILQKIRARREKKINISVPEEVLVFNHVINIKILQRKLEGIEKEIVFFTNSALKTKLLQKLGLVVEKETEPTPTEMQKKRNEQPKNKLNIWWEILRAKWTKEPAEKVSSTKNFMLLRPNRKPIVAFGVLATVLLVAIIYITLPTATVHIKPVLKIKESTLNVILDVNPGRGVNDHDIRLTPIAASFSRSLKITPTGRIPGKDVATGTVTVFNYSGVEAPIVGNSRLQTSDGLVFLTKNFITVPAASGGKPGAVRVQVIARDKDTENLFIGSRGNIAPSTFFLPALSPQVQKLIYARSDQPFTGGSDSFEYFVTKEDIASARKKIEAELNNHANEELKKSIETIANGRRMSLFERSTDMIKKSVSTVNVQAKEGQKITEFEVSGNMKASGFAFDTKQLEDILQSNLITTRMSPTEKILKLKEGSLQINEVLEKDFSAGRAKVNATLQAIITYDFLNSNLDLVQQIRGSIVGRSKSYAEKYVNNLKDVSESSISIWPVWAPTIPTIPENITISIEEPK